jgi:hypothetical protein
LFTTVLTRAIGGYRPQRRQPVGNSKDSCDGALFFSFVLLGSAVVHAKDTTIPTIGFTSTSNLSERAVTIEANAERLVVIEKTADGVAEVEIRLRADSVVVTRKSELQDSRNDIHLPALAAWAKANPTVAANVQEHFGLGLSTPELQLRTPRSKTVAAALSCRTSSTPQTPWLWPAADTRVEQWLASMPRSPIDARKRLCCGAWSSSTNASLAPC